jgi:hypothetical protein
MGEKQISPLRGGAPRHGSGRDDEAFGCGRELIPPFPFALLGVKRRRPGNPAIFMAGLLVPDVVASLRQEVVNTPPYAAHKVGHSGRFP